MTIIFALRNSKYSILMSDRRLSSNGKLIEDESNKTGSFVSSDARMGFAYTGLAEYKNFKTHDWLVDNLYESSKPDYLSVNTFNRLAVKLTNEFRDHKDLKTIPTDYKALEIIFSGYVSTNKGPMLAHCAISNFYNHITNENYEPPSDKFTPYFGSTLASELKEPLLDVFGFHRLVNSKIVLKIRQLLYDQKPPISVIAKTLELIHELADKPASNNTIGKQITSIIIPADLNEAIESNYHSNVSSFETYMPTHVVSMSENTGMIMKGLYVAPADKTTTGPTSVPKVKMKQPCPCGSGKKYKYCHGSRYR